MLEHLDELDLLRERGFPHLLLGLLAQLELGGRYARNVLELLGIRHNLLSQAIYLSVRLIVHELVALEELYFDDVLRLDQVVKALHDLLLVLHHVVQLFSRVVNDLLYLLDVLLRLLQLLV